VSRCVAVVDSKTVGGNERLGEVLTLASIGIVPFTVPLGKSTVEVDLLVELVRVGAL
jgi:hypothetical protein